TKYRQELRVICTVTHAIAAGAVDLVQALVRCAVINPGIVVGDNVNFGEEAAQQRCTAAGINPPGCAVAAFSIYVCAPGGETIRLAELGSGQTGCTGIIASTYTGDGRSAVPEAVLNNATVIAHQATEIGSVRHRTQSKCTR